ncbi:MAG: polyprenyl synthetase family protein [Bacteroidales bacterium]|nr:polyprenyl synthetase family protein [Bacteroidales bacterium]
MAEYIFPQIIKEDIQKFDEMFEPNILSKTNLLNTISKYVFGNKGKQIRPALTFLSARLIGDVTDSTFSAAYMVELLHNATLIHDDVVDDSETRRNLLSVKAKWKNKVAVLAGDYYLAKGLLFAIEKNEIKALEIMSQGVKKMSEGELMQIEHAKSLENTENTYYEIIKAKTAALFVVSMVTGAYSTRKATEDDIKKIERIAELLGLAFQIRDDVLDFSRASVLGKKTLNDLQEKKQTLPLLYALSKVSFIEREKVLFKLEHHNNKQKKLEELAEFVRFKGGIEYATQKQIDFCNEAKTLCCSFAESEARNALCGLIDFIALEQK